MCEAAGVWHIDATEGIPPHLLGICAASCRAGVSAIWETTFAVTIRGSFGIFVIFL
jgi:hypothetical protein